MTSTLYLVDKSAWQSRWRSPQAEHRLTELITSGQAATCQISMLEQLFSARNLEEYRKLRTWMDLLQQLPSGNNGLFAALDIQAKLAQRGQHRMSIPDLIIAATAQQHDATILHYDHDFDLIAEVTGQPTEWIIPRGSI